jgi:excisionase family DNA binding protein
VTTPADQLLLTIEQAAHRLAIGRTKLLELITAGHIETVHIGRARRVVATSVANYYEQLRTTVD